MPSQRVRVRGIYATALTRTFLDAGLTVVQPSEPIAQRFSAELPAEPAAARVHSTPNDEGLRVSGTAEAVAAVIGAVDGIDAPVWSWSAALPTWALLVGEVTETTEHGALVDVGRDQSAFLPYSQTADFVERDDRLVVQVSEPSPPWVPDRRPVVTTNLRVGNELATLGEHLDGVTGPDALVNAMDRLGIDRPREWGLAWHAPAAELGISTLGPTVTRLAEAATTLRSAREESTVTELGPIRQPHSTSWIWFGRQARFAADDRRSSVTETMEGHHRLKAAGGAAASAVDFVEALPEPSPAFDADAAMEAFGPAIGEELSIRHGKPTGEAYDLGSGEVVDRDGDGQIGLRREITSSGTYDALGTDRTPGDAAYTTVMAGRWWYPTVYRAADGTNKGTYVNIGTPLEVFPDRVRYMDLYIDVIKEPDGTVGLVDADELAVAVDDDIVSQAVADRAREVAQSIENAL